MECYSGEVYGFLGPNGAGKTTTIKIAVGLLQLDEGEISIDGKDIRKDFEGAMANVGGIVENPEMYKYLSGLENLRQYARMREGVTEERIKEVVELVRLSNRINDKVSNTLWVCVSVLALRRLSSTDQSFLYLTSLQMVLTRRA